MHDPSLDLGDDETLLSLEFSNTHVQTRGAQNYPLL